PGACNAPVALARARPFADLSFRDTECEQIALPRAVALPFLPAHLPQPPAQPFVELREWSCRVGVREVGRPADRVAIDQPDALLHRDAPAACGQTAQPLPRPPAGVRIDSHLYLPVPDEEAEAQQGPLRRRGNRRFATVDAQLEPLLDVPRDARHDPLPRPLTRDVHAHVVGVTDEAVAALLQLPVEVVQHDVREQRRARRALRRPILARLLDTVSHHAR